MSQPPTPPPSEPSRAAPEGSTPVSQPPTPPSNPGPTPGGQPRPVASWLSSRSVDGGLDEIVLDGAGTGIWLCGKRVTGPDPEAARRRVAARGGDPVILCLCERHELDERYPDYVAWLESGIDGARWAPVHDLGAPLLDAARALGAEVNRWLDAGRPVIIHCGAGLGRAPTIAACALLSRGHELDGIVTAIADSRPMAGPESGAQRDLLDTLAAEVGGSGPRSTE